MTTLMKPIRTSINKCMSFDPRHMLTIQVGKAPHQKSFLAHESFLTSRSEFFRRAMNGNWRESETHVVELPEDSPAVFAFYLNFAYTGQLTTMRKSEEELATLDLGPFEENIHSEYNDLFCLYVLAEKLQDVTTKNATLAAVIDVTKIRSVTGPWIIPKPRAIGIIYRGTTEGNPFRRWVVDMYSALSIDCILKVVSTRVIHKDFVSDLAKAIEEIRPCNSRGGSVVMSNGVEAYMENI